MVCRPQALSFLIAATFCTLLALPARAQTPPAFPANPNQAGNSSAPPAAPSPSKAPAFKPDPRKAKDAFKQGLRAEHASDWDAAYGAYSDAINWAPENKEYFLHHEFAKSRLVQTKLDLAEREAVSGRLSDARRELLSARAIDPSNRAIQERYTELAAIQSGMFDRVKTEADPAGEVRIEHQPGTRDFDYRGDTSGAYQEIARQFGVQVAFDVELRPRQIRFRMAALDFPTALRVLGQMTGTFWRPLTRHLFFVAEDTVQKRKDYDISIVRTVLLPASDSREQMTEILRLVREIAGITRSELDIPSGTLTLRAGPQAMAIATSLIEDLEKPGGELVLEIEILEVDRNYARELGITPPESARTFTLSKQEVLQALSSPSGLATVLQEVFGTPSSLSGLTNSQIGSLLGSGQVSLGSLLPPLIAFGGGYTTFLLTLQGAAAHFSEMLSLVRHGRRILLRAEDGRPATFFVGDRVPVTLAQFSPSLAGVGGSVPGATTTNFPISNLDTGAGPTFVTSGILRSTGSNQDLIVANNTANTLSIFLGNGDGTFTAPNPATIATGNAPVWIATGNFNTDTTKPNHDTNLDLAVVNQGDNTVSIFLGNGDGTFKTPSTAANTILSTGPGSSPVSVVAANLTNSGFTDLVVADHANNTLQVFLGNGDGTFKAPSTTAHTIIIAGAGPSSIAAADFNADGKIDLAVTNELANTVSIFLGNGDGTFASRTDYATGNSPVWVSSADFNGDGILDLAVANNGAPTSTVTGNTVSILLGQANATGGAAGTFTNSVDFPAGAGPASIAVADYNIDGRLDLAVADQTDNAISLLLGLGNGQFGPNFELAVGTDPISIVTADFNGSGKPDVAVANKGSDTVSVILNESAFGAGNALPETPFPGVQYLDIGVKVKATPRIHDNDEVTLQMNFEISSLTTQAFNGIPVIASQAITQTVRLKQNETTAIAGILQPQQSTTLGGTPGITGLPIVGLLGSTQMIQNQDSELLILITPRTVELSAHKDHVVYAGHHALESVGSFGPTRQERQEREGGPGQPQAPPQPPPQPLVEPGAQPAPGQPPPQPQPQPQPQAEPPRQ
jgi:type II secretory pathway component GspD/PulD (secretin)